LPYCFKIGIIAAVHFSREVSADHSINLLLVN